MVYSNFSIQFPKRKGEIPMSQNLGCYLSDDGRTVVVLEGDREEQYTVDEFVMIYGEEALPVGKKDGYKIVITDEQVEALAQAEEEAEKRQEAVNTYYETMKDFLNAVGWHQGFLKLVDRYDTADSEAEKSRIQAVIEDDAKVPIQFIDQEIHEKDKARQTLYVKLNDCAEQVGLPRIEEGKMMDILKFLSLQPRRESIRNRIKPLQAKREAVSLEELIAKRKRWEKNHAEKRGEKYDN